VRSLRDLADIPVTRLKGVGPEKARALEQHLDIASVLDLLTHYPYRIIDRTRAETIKDLEPGDAASVLARVRHSSVVRGRGKARVVVDVTDGSGHLRISFFNQVWRANQLREGTEAIFFGEMKIFGGRKTMANPVVDLVGDRTGRIIPVYRQSDKARIHTWDLARWVAESLRRAEGLVEPVPRAVIERFDYMGRDAAMRSVHDPESESQWFASRARLIFDELLRIQLALVLRKRVIERTSKGIAHVTTRELAGRFIERLPFELTDDQVRVIDEISADLASPVPMHRLLQGDVGSGKTVVAVCALLTAVEGGHQGAFMAPTAVLAEQHFAGMRALLADLPLAREGGTLFGRTLRVELLTNRTTAAERRRLLADLEAGEIDLLVGTHALIQEGVAFRSLGVVVIDEQHRFGVEQRAALRDKGRVEGAGAPEEHGGAVPDVLVMTATPIPRTAAMTVYGDLDVSTIGHMPAGRRPITTSWARTPLDQAAVWAHARDEVAAGRQVYVVCPLIEGSEKLEATSAEETFARLSADELSGLRLALLHGRMTPAEKEQTMDLFRRGAVQVLVATTVIEVGVDVPNATVMVVLDADRFGIAQLHQLRGRVGRGAAKSYCYLVSADETPDAERRLGALVASTDGFLLADVDLEIRGEGTIMGERQKGRNDLKLASLRRDREIVERARAVAFEIVDADPRLEHLPDLRSEVELFLDDDDAEFLLKS
jgi:ATP-dependent DNA helicase RecG